LTGSEDFITGMQAETVNCSWGPWHRSGKNGIILVIDIRAAAANRGCIPEVV